MSASEAPLRFVVLASGEGTNAARLLEAAAKDPARYAPLAVISDRAGAPVLEIAARHGVAAEVVPAKDEAAQLALLKRLAPRWAFLAGYRRLVSQGFLDFFADQGFFRVLNVHPSLLPAYPGLEGYERAWRDGLKCSGVTVHLVDSGLDTGLPVLQESFACEEGESLEAFKARGRALEHILFPRALELAASGRIRIREENGRRWVSTAEGAMR